MKLSSIPLLRRFGPGTVAPPDDRSAIVESVTRQLFTCPADYQRLERSNRQFAESGLADYLFATPDCEHLPDEVFNRLRWGGQFVFVSEHERQIKHLHRQYQGSQTFHVDAVPQVCAVDQRPAWWRLGRKKKQYFFAARKVMLTKPGDPTERYSYDVRLMPTGNADEPYVVAKQVPTMQRTIQRLALRFPDASAEMVEKGARKLVQKVFPLFLTREAAMLKILQRDLPDQYRKRMPRVLHTEKDEQGFVQKLHLNWLRLGGNPLTQTQFAQQAAQLLHVLHETVDVIHLDLRLDNFVITEQGVGFVDFGSAVRDGEKINRSPMLTSLFTEMLSTSQIHIDLARLRDRGKVTSSLFLDAYRQIDKAVDLFYLVLQMNYPFGNPDFKGLVEYTPGSCEAKQLAALSRAVLQPSDPDQPQYRTAQDVLDGIEKVEQLVTTG